MSKEEEFRKSQVPQVPKPQKPEPQVPLMNTNRVVIFDPKSKIYGRRNENGDLVATYWEDLTPEQQEYVVKNTPHAPKTEIEVPKKGAAPTQDELAAFWEDR